MSSTFSPTLRLELIGEGNQSGIWGQTTNSNLGTLIEQAITGVVSITMLDANYTLSNFNGVSDEARNAVLVLTGTLTAQRNLIAPLVEKTYSVKNTTTGGFGVQIVGASGTGVVIPNGQTIPVYCDGSNFYALVTGSSANFNVAGNLAVTGTSTFTGIPSGPTAALGTNTTQLATTAFVLTNGVPAGCILLWSGSIATIPSGFFLCNGLNGTPDLRDRFVVGAGTTYAVGATGGNTTTTLVEANLPSHTHSISASGTTASVNIDHTHSISASGTTAAVNVDHVHSLSASGTTSLESNDHAHSGATGSENANHSHTFSGTTAGMNANNPHSHGVSDPGHAHSLEAVVGRYGYGGQFGVRGDYANPSAASLSSTGAAATSISINDSDINHAHGYSGTTSGISANHQHAFSTGGVNANHNHTVSVSGTSGAMSANASHSHTVTVTGTSGAMSANNIHNHTVTVTGTSGGTGSGTAFSNLPPYYALAYIMKA